MITNSSESLNMIPHGTIDVWIYPDNACDEKFYIQDSNGFSLWQLNEFNEALYDFVNDDQFLGKDYLFSLILKPIYIKEQRGDYPPPNIESEAYWDFKIINIIDYRTSNEDIEDIDVENLF